MANQRDGLEKLQDAFLEEAPDLIEQLSERIEALPKVPRDRFRRELTTILRIAHNLKGAAASVGSDLVEAAAHMIEDALAPAKQDPAHASDELCMTVLRVLAAVARFVAGEADEDEVHVALSTLKSEASSGHPGPASSQPKKSAPPPIEPPHPEIRATHADAGRAGAGSTTSIRVETTRLDHLMGFSGELLVTRGRMGFRHRRLKELAQDLASLTADEIDPFQLEELAKRLRVFIQQDDRELAAFSHLTEDLNDAIRRLRMLSLAGLEGIWRRIVRESALQCGREARLELDVGDIELDKQVIERLRDPMMHLLRNAVHHGIEGPEERAARGKPREGRIRVSADTQGAFVRLEVSDDGRGLDPVRIGDTAVRKGIINEETRGALGRAELVELVFRPGFSTAREVTRQSGRGVGLDVVRERVERLGGRVFVSETSRLGGATFSLATPASIVSTTGFFVSNGGTVYALPLEYVERAAHLKENALQEVDGTPVVSLEDGEPVRLVRLDALLGLVVPTESDRMSQQRVVILSHRGMRLGVTVTEVLGQREYVTHELPWNLKGVRGVGGAIIQADGSLAVALEGAHLFEAARTADQWFAQKGQATSFQRARRILVVDDSLTSRTLEGNMLRAAGYAVTVAADGEKAWRRLVGEDFDLVVADIRMPNMDGFELTRMIRQSPRHHDLPVVLVTSLARPEDRAAGASAGADEYLVKGQFSQRELLEAVAKYL